MSEARVLGISMNGDSVVGLLTCAGCGRRVYTKACHHCGSTERRKTNTRRMCKLPEFYDVGDDLEVDIAVGRVKPRYAVGDHLYVLEAWVAQAVYDNLKPSEIPQRAVIRYRADSELNIPAAEERDFSVEWGRYRHTRFMCKWMARIWLEVTGVWPERLLDISEEDALAEGIYLATLEDEGFVYVYGETVLGNYEELGNAKKAYWALWDIIHGPYAAEKNPWVWANEFKLMEEK